jgi:hypothetical protein
VPKELTQARVEQWISMATGAFTLQDIQRELNINTEESKNYLRVVINRLASGQSGILERVGKKDGVFRPIDKTANEISLENIDLDTKVNLLLPFDIHEYVEFYPGNIILVAGESNSGKTSFLYNTAILNCYSYTTDFYTNNEASPQEILKRLKPFDLPKPMPFKIYERYDNYADVIVPGHVSIIDYLDMNSEVYLAGEEIERIHRKLGGGIAIIGMQLPPAIMTEFKGVKKLTHRSLAYGGAFTIKKPVLYLDLWKDGAANTGICKIEKAKNRAKPNTDPNNMMWKYVIDEWGAQFISVERYYKTNEVENNY